MEGCKYMVETTICPWCQTEIVWDEELGPEEECPYCHNELKGYRTLNIALGSDEDWEDEDETSGDDTDDAGLWQEDEESHLNAIRRVEAFAGAGGDLLAYESGVEKQLDAQEEVPECPHCREYMLHAGTEPLSPGFKPVQMQAKDTPILQSSAVLNVYVCSACFQVSRFLSEDDRNQLIKTVSEE